MTGPYAHTRNPLYFGSFLIGAGFAIAAHWALLLVVIAFWILVYAPTMQRERANISERFPEAYARYAEQRAGVRPSGDTLEGRAIRGDGGFSFDALHETR